MGLFARILTMLVVSLLILAIVLTSLSIRSLNLSGQREIQRIETSLMGEKKQMLMNLVTSVVHITEVPVPDEEYIQLIKTMRYGPEGKGYFWINSTDKPYPRMIMHPIAPQLDGKILDDPKYNCAMDKEQNLFAAGVEATENSKGKGFFHYKYPKPGDNSNIAYPKLSAAVKVPGKNWVIGTGLYVDDIEATIMEIDNGIAQNIKNQIKLLVACAVGLLLVAIVIAFFSDKNSNETHWGYRGVIKGTCRWRGRFDQDAALEIPELLFNYKLRKERVQLLRQKSSLLDSCRKSGPESPINLY